MNARKYIADLEAIAVIAAYYRDVYAHEGGKHHAQHKARKALFAAVARWEIDRRDDMTAQILKP